MNIKNTDLIPFTSGQRNIGSVSLPWNILYSTSGVFNERPTVNGVEIALLSDPLGGDQNLNDLNDVDTTLAGPGSGLIFDGSVWLPSGIVTEISGLTNRVALVPADSYIAISASGADPNNYNRLVFKNNGVTVLNGLSRDITIESLDGSITVAAGNQAINLQAVANSDFFPVDSRVASGSIIPDTDSAYSLGLNDRRWSFLYADSIIAGGTVSLVLRPTVGGVPVALSTDTLPSSGVISINSLSGLVGLASLNDGITISSSSNNITLESLITRASGVLYDYRFGQLITNSGFPTFNQILDVNVASAASGQVPVFDGSNWVPRTNIAGSVGSINNVSGEVSLLSANDAITIANTGEPSNQITLTGRFTSISGQLVDELIAASGYPTLNQLLDVNVVNPSAASGNIIVFDGANWVAREETAAGVNRLNGLSGALTISSSNGTVDVSTPDTSTIDLAIDSRYPQKRSWEFTEASGAVMQFYHDLNTVDFTWSLYRRDRDPISPGFYGERFNIIPKRISPSGGQLIVVELNAATSGYLVVVG